MPPRPFPLAVAAVLVLTSLASARIQRRPAGQQKPTVAIETSLQAGGERIASSASGRCEHAPMASLYDVISEMWRVEQTDDAGKGVTLTLWAPKDGSARMFTLSVSGGGTSHSVQISRKQPSQGSGTVTLEPSAKGGTFKIDAKTAKGTAITGTIKCSAFTPAIAEGGE